MVEVKKDWTRKEIISALLKSGTTLDALANKTICKLLELENVFLTPWAEAEFIIANRLGIHPSEIWPSRYFDSKGKPIDRQRKL
ncbi:helix-turn-helix domain-containing protein [Arsenophonus sp. aPb]|uniref:helix-turn-helix domain-containing protein n=1 Tax=Arsenophonus sp. aPb TaxID=3041619 RepID=UPI00246880B0|nr:helix-turn-helix domain-containing protein [Arsenophonus sp. aPb]WGL98657.1 helix-turn-helix domain-containing protein [Arsenophonus sp. aPb]